MEEPADAGKIRFRAGLLTLRLFLLLVPVLAAQAQQPDSSGAERLSLVPESEWFFTGSDVSFLLRIPDAVPRQVTLNMRSLPDSVRLVSSYKDEFVYDGGRGTSVRLWFSFSEPGVFRLPDLGVQVGWRRFSVPFETVTVYPDPAQLRPELSVRLISREGKTLSPDSDGKFTVPAGETTRILVSVLYAAQVAQLGWQLPPDALLSEAERYSVADSGRGSRSFSPDSEPVALFDWVPLEQGVCRMPSIIVDAVTYAGQRVELSVPELAVEAVAPAPAEKDAAFHVPDALEAAFDEPHGQEASAGQTDVAFSGEPLVLAALRARERFALPFSSAAKDRFRYEQEHGLDRTESERSVVLLAAMALASALCLVLFPVFLMLRKKRAALVLGILAVPFAAMALAYGLPLAQDTGIFAGGPVRIIPEEAGGDAAPIAPLTRVRVLERAGKWVYIESPAGGGWVPQDNVVKISRALLSSAPGGTRNDSGSE